MPDTNAADEPSRIGTSGPSSSIRALWTPVPASAAMMCSMVETVAPSAPFSSVQSCDGTTAFHSAGMGCEAGRSVRTNTMPWPAGAGRSAMRAGAPE